MKKKIIKSIEDILFNNYKTNIDENLADNLYERKNALQNELLNKSTLAKILKLTNSVQDLLKFEKQDTVEFKKLVEMLLKMDNALNRNEIINQILNDE